MIVDCIYIYAIVMLTIQIVVPIFISGQAKTGKYSFYDGIIYFIIYSPLYGRLFGWW